MTCDSNDISSKSAVYGFSDPPRLLHFIRIIIQRYYEYYFIMNKCIKSHTALCNCVNVFVVQWHRVIKCITMLLWSTYRLEKKRDYSDSGYNRSIMFALFFLRYDTITVWFLRMLWLKHIYDRIISVYI